MPGRSSTIGNPFDRLSPKIRRRKVTLLRCFNVQAHNLSRAGAQRADVTIAPNVSMFKSSAFTQTPEMADIGYRTTMETLPQIREFLQKLDDDLFRVTSAKNTQ